MAVVTYTYPEPTTCADDFGLTRQYELPPVVECGTDLLRDPCGGFNPNRCATDAEYINPVVDGDVLWIQTRLPDPVNNWTDDYGYQSDATNWQDEGYTPFLRVYVIDNCAKTDTLIPLTEDYFATAWVGRLSDTANVPPGFRGQYVQVVGIKVDLLPDQFTLRIEHPTLGDYYTEPYRKVACEGTVLLEGRLYSVTECTTDVNPTPTCGDSGCDNNLQGWDADSPYVAFPEFLSWRNQVRVYGSFERLAYNYEFDRNSRGENFGIKASDVWQLRTGSIPPYIATKIAAIFASDQLVIDGDAESIWQAPEAVQRNRQSGSMWILDVQVKRLYCDRDSGCV